MTAPPTASEAPLIHGDFPRTWQARILSAPPLIAPARQLTFPRQVPGEEDALARGALLLLIQPAAEPSFLATCALGFRSPTVPTGIWSTPHPDTLCAVVGGYSYLIPASDPAAATQIPLRPVTAILPVEPLGLLLFAGFHHLVAWGPDGIAWQTARLSWEGVTLGNVEGTTLHGTGWHLHTDRELPFTVDLRTGNHTGGGFTP